MTPERLDYLNKENILRGECSITRDELHWLFTRLREMTARKEALQKRLQEVNPDQPLAGWKAGDGPGLNEPVWGESKTSEGDVGREDHSSAPNSTSPPAEAPQESGVPSGKAGCRACDPLNPGDVGEPHTCSLHSPGILRGEYERMAREWLRADMMSLYYGAAGATSNELRVASLTALLRARDAATWQRACDELRNNFPKSMGFTVTEQADWLASRGPKEIK